MAGFLSSVKTIIQDKMKEIQTTLLRKLDQWENTSLPQVELSTNFVDFGQVAYQNEISRELMIRNIGSSTAHFRFVPPPEEKNVCKPFLSVYPMFGMLIPDESQILTLSVFIDKTTAQQIHSQTISLEDILILKLENGRDFFIPINLSYLSSCFGCSLEYLATSLKPIRDVGKTDDDEEKVEDVTTPSNLSIPKELWRMVDDLYQRGMRFKDIFISTGHPEEVRFSI